MAAKRKRYGRFYFRAKRKQHCSRLKRLLLVERRAIESNKEAFV
jgi:hypothetical protein